MSINKVPNDVHRNDLYANLPVHNILNGEMNGRHLKSSDPATVENLNSHRKPPASKEMLYATPLRKSDRFKTRDKSVSTSKSSSNHRHHHHTTSDNEKINNTDPSAPHRDDSPSGGAMLNNNGDVDHVLGERRILSFLKDTSQLQKKMEMHRGFPNSNFSCLAREEHFANLVQQNVVNAGDGSAHNHSAETALAFDDDAASEDGEMDRMVNLESEQSKKQSPDKEVGDLISLDGSPLAMMQMPRKETSARPRPPIGLGGSINREWVLKKIAMCLEQRSAKPKSSMHPAAASESISKLSGAAASIIPIQQHMGCIIMGSNGSGKTTVCESILNGANGTKGLLNRKLLGCYFVNSQNPDCHNLSMFIRSLILQILSHSSYLTKEDQSSEMSLEKKREARLPLDEEEQLIAQLKRVAVVDVSAKNSPSKRESMLRQQSEPVPGKEDEVMTGNDGTPTQSKSCGGSDDGNNSLAEDGDKNRCKPKISKIPVKIGLKSPKRGELSLGTSPPKEDDQDVKPVQANDLCEAIQALETKPEEVPPIPSTSSKIPESPSPPTVPAPLPPKSKSCRTSIADEYYEMLMSNPDILEHLYADNIEKNPDDSFKKAILFPLLELTPPKQALLLLIDSIDENYINEGNLISTLKGRNSTKSRNIAELLSNHIHLFPKWLFLVCTAKKQNKHITKIFSGFKRITLDDLRKSHVVKDVQEYIINRLNSDFKGSIHLTKEVIESLNQLYIKSNGCILYLQKVLNGILDSFFSFREIKLIPCTLNGLYLYICQKSFNKKQYLKIRPILNVLLACSGFVERFFVLNCLRAHNYSIDADDFDRRVECMRTVLVCRGNQIKIFHNSFSDWLVDVKFATKKFLCDVNEGHIMISMYYTLISETLCANQVRRYIYHLIKASEYLSARNIHLDLILVLLESKTNLSDCFYTNLLNCCERCEAECKNDLNFLAKTREIIDKFLNNELSEDFSSFLCDFFKPNLPTDAKTLKLLIETGINNADGQLSYESSLTSPVVGEKSQNLDSELAELLISSERSCHQEALRPDSPRESLDLSEPPSDDHNPYSRLGPLSDSHNLELHKGKALIHILANEGNHVLLERALRACKDPIDLEIEDTSGQTALNIASRNGHIEVVTLLLNVQTRLPTGNNGGKVSRIYF